MIQNLVLSIFVFAFCFLLLEVVFKAIAFIQPNQAGPTNIPGLPYENTPSVTFWRYDQEAGLNKYSHNKFGMRDEETEIKKPDNTFRIAFLGDSIVHGGNVSQGQDATAVLEEELNKTIEGEKYEVLNFGVASYGLFEYSVLMESKVVEFSPDLVIIGLCINDYWMRKTTEDNQESALEEKNSDRSWWKERFQNLMKSHFYEYLAKTTSIDEWLSGKEPTELINPEALEKLRALNHLTNQDQEAIIKHVKKNRIPLQSVVDSMEEYITEEVWEANDSNIRKIIEFNKTNGVKVVFFAFPLSEQVALGYRNNKPQSTIKSIVERNGGHYIEFLELFRNYVEQNPETRLYPTYDNMHMFKQGHRMVANHLKKELEQLNLI